MKAALSRAVLQLAVRCLDHRRHEWALAMEAEFEAATEDGKPLTFAIGCLLGALREMPAHDEGRFVIANYVLAVGLIVPVTVMLLGNIIGEFGQFGTQDMLSLGRGSEPLLTDGTRPALPSLGILLLLLGTAQLRIAWALLDCDWERVADTGRMIAALTVTLAIVSGLVFVSDTGLVHASVAAIELTAVLILARWHAQLPLGAASGSNAP